MFGCHPKVMVLVVFSDEREKKKKKKKKVEHRIDQISDSAKIKTKVTTNLSLLLHTISSF